MSAEIKKTGIVDEPIKPFLKGEIGQEDRLGINDYAQALQTFIENTDTPMTVGIQGEWGSGKTSLMNKIWKELEGIEKNTRYESIWINTWEHSLLKSPEEALISIVNEISQKISLLNPKNDKAKKIIATGKKVFSGVLKVAAGVTMGVAGKEVADDLLSGQADNSIKQLRADLEDFINSTIDDTSTSEIKNISKIVFYIDDLDRIEPKDAVKILELLKNIFSLKHCVFILAIDYQVIIKGLKDKFGEKTEENEREFRSFFDKIIQLPFTMPISKYSVSEYVLSLLEEIGFIDDKDQLPEENVEDILRFTIGGNPRSLKRLINSLSLINILNQVRDKKNEKETIKDDSLLIFALICCQVAYPKIYDLISLKPNVKEWNDEFAAEITQKKEELDPNFKDIFDKVKESEDFDEAWEQAVFKISYISLDTKKHASNISKFLSLLVNEGIIDSPEQLDRVLMNTAATVVTASDFAESKKPPARAVMDNVEGTLEAYRIIAKEENLSESEIEKAIIYATKMHNVILELFKNNKNFSVKYSRDSISYSTNKGGKKKTRFARIFCGTVGTLDALYKDHKKDFKMPKINDVDTLQLRVFNKTAKSWAFSYAYRLNLGLEGYDNNIEIINQLILRSAEILESSEPTLPEVKNTSKLDDKELDRLVLIGSNDYTYDV